MYLLEDLTVTAEHLRSRVIVFGLNITPVRRSASADLNRSRVAFVFCWIGLESGLSLDPSANHHAVLPWGALWQFPQSQNLRISETQETQNLYFHEAQKSGTGNPWSTSTRRIPSDDSEPSFWRASHFLSPSPSLRVRRVRNMSLTFALSSPKSRSQGKMIFCSRAKEVHLVGTRHLGTR